MINTSTVHAEIQCALKAATMDEIFEISSSFYVKYRTLGKF